MYSKQSSRQVSSCATLPRGKSDGSQVVMQLERNLVGVQFDFPFILSKCSPPRYVYDVLNLFPSSSPQDIGCGPAVCAGGGPVAGVVAGGTVG